MKKVLFLTSFIFLLCITTLFGQNPAMSYQAIVRDGNGQLIANQSVTATIKVRIGSTDIFNQTYNVNTNAHGLLTLNFGDPIFMSTNWENASISCEVRQGGNVYMAENFQSVVAVPLSLYATSMNRDTLHSYLDTDGHILDIRHYMQQNRQYIIYNDIIIHQALEDTAAHIRREMAIMDSAIRSALVDTARDIRIALVDSSRDIRIALVDSSADIRSALLDSASDIRAALVDSARDIRIALVDSAADIRSALVDTAADIRTDMALMEVAIRSALVDTARDIRIALVDSSRDIRIALVDSSADIRSALVDSARDIRIALVDTAADIRTALLDTAADIRTFVGNRETAIRSALVDTAADIRTALLDSAADIRTFVGVRETAVRSALVDTATNIRSALIDTAADIRRDMGLMDTTILSHLNDSVVAVRSALHDSITNIRTDMSGFITTETDPHFNTSVAKHITAADTNYWNAKQEALTPGTGINITSNTISATFKTYSIGDTIDGVGIVFYVDDSGQHGLMMTTTDEASAYTWRNDTSVIIGSLGNGLYAGEMNTAISVASQIPFNRSGDFAAKACVTLLKMNSYSNAIGGWYLPSGEELRLMKINLSSSISTGLTHWSSSEVDDNNALTLTYSSFTTSTDKSTTHQVRCIRSF